MKKLLFFSVIFFLNSNIFCMKKIKEFKNNDYLAEVKDLEDFFDLLNCIYDFRAYNKNIEDVNNRLKRITQNKIAYCSSVCKNNNILFSDLVLKCLPKLNKYIVKEFIETLKRENISIDYVNNDPVLIFAIKNKDTKLVESLLNYYDSNTKDDFGNPALFWAIKKNCFDILKLLVESGANLNVKTDKNETILMYAAARYRDDFVSYLLEKGANVNAVNIDGYSALTIAVKNNSFKIAQILINNKADVNIVDNYGNNLLIHLIKSYELYCRGLGKNNLFYEFESLFDLLIKSGIDINFVNYNGSNALKISIDFGFLEIIKYLISKGATLEYNYAHKNYSAVNYALEKYKLVQVTNNYELIEKHKKIFELLFKVASKNTLTEYNKNNNINFKKLSL